MARDLNYYDTFIAVAGDCPATAGTPPRAGKAGKAGKTGVPTVAQVEFALVDGHPYEHDQNDVLLAAHVRAQVSDLAALPAAERDELRAAFLSRPQACFRGSPLPKRLGWGVHCDGAGRIAIYGVESDDYRRLADDGSLTQLRALRSARATPS